MINNVAVVVMYDKEARLASLYTENGVVKYFDTLYDAECKRDEIAQQNANIKASVTTFCIL